MSSKNRSFNFYIECPVYGSREDIVNFLHRVADEIESGCVGAPIPIKDVSENSPYWFCDDREEDDILLNGEDCHFLADNYTTGFSWLESIRRKK